MAETRALTGLQQCNTPSATLLHSPLQQYAQHTPPFRGCCGVAVGEKKIRSARGAAGPGGVWTVMGLLSIRR
jgi:hypothetical protein